MDGWFVFDDSLPGRVVYARKVEGGTEFATVNYVDELVDANKQQFNLASSDWKGDYHLVASLPPNLAYGDGYIASALREGDEKSISKYLNDSDNRAWRTKGGKV